MPDDAMFQEAKGAIAQGQNERARDLLTRLLRADQTNAEYWLWMSAVVDTAKERTYCLQNTLRLDPDNRAAKRGLILAGAIPADDVTPVPPLRRKWEVIEEKAPAPEVRSPRAFQMMLFLSLAVLVIGLTVVGLLGTDFGKRGLFEPRLTITPRPWTPRPTATLPPTSTPAGRTATPTFVGPKPLWMQLDATYTPTPLYVNTPHPVSEAYRAGLREFQRGNYPSMLLMMEQVVNLEPQAADAYYYIGEAQLLMGRIEEALTAYEKAIDTNPIFAPPYLGRARARLALRPKEDVKADLDKAITLDPAFVEAYLHRAAFLLKQGKGEVALEDLAAVEALSPESPLLYLYRAQYFLSQDRNAEALVSAQRAHQLDFTLLPAYSLLAQVYLRKEQPQEAIGPAQTYTLYTPRDANGWLVLGQALYESGGNYQEAVKSLDKALTLDENLIQAYRYRGLSYVELGKGKAAVNDLYQVIQVEKDSFVVNLAFARALWLDNRLEDAISLFNTSENLAEDDKQLAEVYYWRAQAYETSGNTNAAVQDWQALLVLLPDLPASVRFEAWATTAEEHLQSFTPTTTTTPLSSPTKGTLTPTPTVTSLTPTRTATPSTPTRTATSSTPTRTTTPASPTPTP